jgi:hypothetical protein
MMAHGKHDDRGRPLDLSTLDNAKLQIPNLDKANLEYPKLEYANGGF